MITALETITMVHNRKAFTCLSNINIAQYYEENQDMFDGYHHNIESYNRLNNDKMA